MAYLPLAPLRDSKYAPVASQSAPPPPPHIFSRRAAVRVIHAIDRYRGALPGRPSTPPLDRSACAAHPLRLLRPSSRLAGQRHSRHPLARRRPPSRYFHFDHWQLCPAFDGRPPVACVALSLCRALQTAIALLRARPTPGSALAPLGPAVLAFSFGLLFPVTALRRRFHPPPLYPRSLPFLLPSHPHSNLYLFLAFAHSLISFFFFFYGHDAFPPSNYIPFHAL